MAQDSLLFDTMLERLQHTLSITADVLRGSAGLRISNICYCPQVRTLQMQCMGLPYLKTLIAENRFQPRGAKLEHASTSTCIMINFLSNAEYMEVEHVHIGLIIIQKGFCPREQKDILPFLDVIHRDLQATHEKELRQGHKLPMPRSYSLFTASFGGWKAVPTDPPYCLVYPMEFIDGTPAAAKDHCHPENTCHALCTRQCVCCHTLQYANMSPDDQMEYTSSQLLIPHRVQYSEDGIPQLVKPRNHRGPFLDSNNGKPYPMHNVRNFSLDNVLFPGVPGDSFLYDGDV